MVQAVAQVYLDALWALLDLRPVDQVDQAQLEILSSQIAHDPQLTEVERASLLGMLKALGGTRR